MKDKFIERLEKLTEEHITLREQKTSDYEFVSGLICNILGEIGDKDGQFELYSDNATACVYSIKNGNWDKIVARARNLKELATCLESIRLYKEFKKH